MHAVAGHAVHVVPFVRIASPKHPVAVPGVTLQTGFVGLSRRQLGRIDRVLGFRGLNVLFAIAVAALARRRARIR